MTMARAVRPTGVVASLTELDIPYSTLSTDKVSGQQKCDL